ncbi:MAG: hypothetical protein KGM44_13180 [bacterium]|nr:hypothetical protein [bacterium]
MITPPAPGSPFLLGVNYWPRRSAMGWWRRFDAGELAEDCARIATLGMRVLRWFLDWELLQPDPAQLDEATLANADRVLDLCAQHGLLAMPTLFTGHMSGVNWLPAWTLDAAQPPGRFRTIARGVEQACGIGDLYADPALLRAQTFCAARLAERWRGHPALWAIDLGNEFSNLREPARPSDAADWSARLCDALAPAGVATTGGLHGEDVERDRGIRPSSISASWSLATMHGYAVYSPWSAGRLDTDAVPFLGAVMRAFQGGRPLLFSEWGGPQCPHTRAPGGDEAEPFECYSEEELAAYAMGALERLHREGAVGALYWCWSDYDPALATQPPFDRAPWEMRFGLCDERGRLKQVGERLQSFARDNPTVQRPAPFAQDEAAWYADPPRRLREAYARYRAMEE